MWKVDWGRVEWGVGIRVRVDAGKGVRDDGSGKVWVYLEDKANGIWISCLHIDGMWRMREKEE